MSDPRPGPAQRGYDREHKELRKQWLPLVEAGKVNCWRCRRLILPGTAWDLGHDDQDRSLYRGPEHAASCNRAAAGRKSGELRRGRKVEPHPGLLPIMK